MDFAAFNERKSAEKGLFVVLNHPYEDEPTPLGEDGFFVRGAASETYQAALAEEMFSEVEADIEEGDSAEKIKKSLETMAHEKDVDAALKLIISANPEMQYDGKPVGSDPEQIRAVLNCTFPEMRVATDDDGKPKMRTVTGKDGEKIEIPQFEQANKTFAAQVIQAAGKRSAFFGSTSAA